MIIVCPSCKKDLIRKEESYTCKSCSKQYYIKNNILLLRGDSPTWFYNFKTDVIPTSKDDVLTNFLKILQKGDSKKGLM